MCIEIVRKKEFMSHFSSLNRFISGMNFDYFASNWPSHPTLEYFCSLYDKRFSALKVKINLQDYYAIPDPSKKKIYFQFAAA